MHALIPTLASSLQNAVFHARNAVGNSDNTVSESVRAHSILNHGPLDDAVSPSAFDKDATGDGWTGTVWSDQGIDGDGSTLVLSSLRRYHCHARRCRTNCSKWYSARNTRLRLRPCIRGMWASVVCAMDQARDNLSMGRLRSVIGVTLMRWNLGRWSHGF